MGMLMEMLRSRSAEKDLQDRLAEVQREVVDARLERNDAWNEQQRLRTDKTVLTEQMAAMGRFADEQRALISSLESKNEQLYDMLGDARDRAEAQAGLLERLVTVERHNATYQATTQWAVAHINAIAIERGSLIDRLDNRQGTHPVPAFQLEAPDVTMAPPPGPIGIDGIVGGRPIPEGKTAGDVINALRQKREREAAQRPAGAGELLREAAELFEETPTGGDSQESQPADPFADIP